MKYAIPVTFCSSFIMAYNNCVFLQQSTEELADDAQYFKRLTGGLFTLQLVDRIILEVGI